MAADPNLSSILSNRIYPNIAPEGIAQPWIVWHIIASEPVDHLDGGSALMHLQVQFDCVARNALLAWLVADRVAGIYEDSFNTADDERRSSRLINSFEQHILPKDGTELGIFRVVQTYSFWVSGWSV